MKNDWNHVGTNGKRNDKVTEYAERTAEDRLSKAKKKPKKSRYILTMLAYLVVLVIVMYVAGVLFTWINGKLDKAQEDAAQAVSMLDGQDSGSITYSQEELDAILAQAAGEADARVEQASRAREEEILNGIKTSLMDGTTTVETLRPFYPDELVLVSSGTFHFVPIREDLKHNTLAQEKLQIQENGELLYLEGDQVISHKGIDVSKHQGDIDWEAVAAEGVEFAFIRVGLRGYETGKLVEDGFFEDNIKEASDAGIKVGVYLYTQAVTEEEILEEADFVLDKIEPYTLDCPIVIDVEKVAGAKARMNDLTLEERTKLVLLFCETIENAGYKPMIYHNMEMGVLMLDLGAFENYDKWFASYSDTLYYPYAYDIWQYSDKGRINGIETDVDLNISFSPFWEG